MGHAAVPPNPGNVRSRIAVERITMSDGRTRSVHAPTLAQIARVLGPILLCSLFACRSTPAPAGTPPDTDDRAAPSIANDDPKWGNPSAPVTIVWFGDYLCPFTAKSAETISQLESEYGPQKLRVVWKSEPHPFEARGIELAEAGEVVRGLGGSDAFWRFQRLAFANQENAGARAFAEWARESGVDADAFSKKFAARAGAEKVARDHALAQQLGVKGTPQFFVNGKPIKGAVPIETFETAIRLALRQPHEK
jgi:protein-disulfide isomerase